MTVAIAADRTADEKAQDEANDAIKEDALEVYVERQYVILLGTGGPAVRIVGGLDDFSDPESAKLQCQDWFTRWIDLEISEADEVVLLEYAQRFYFGSDDQMR